MTLSTSFHHTLIGTCLIMLILTTHRTTKNNAKHFLSDFICTRKKRRKKIFNRIELYYKTLSRQTSLVSSKNLLAFRHGMIMFFSSLFALGHTSGLSVINLLYFVMVIKDLTVGGRFFWVCWDYSFDKKCVKNLWSFIGRFLRFFIYSFR